MYKKIYNSKVLELFFNNPEGKVYIREIARQTNLHPNTVIRDVNELVKENLLLKRVTKAMVEIRTNKESELFYILKKLYNISKLYFSGLVDFINKEYIAPEAIILFGSYSRGEDILRSDIDIAIITKREIKFDLSKYEKILDRAIQIHEIELEKAGKTFITNLANGFILKGYLNT